jgi:hypothetical protein
MQAHHGVHPPATQIVRMRAEANGRGQRKPAPGASARRSERRVAKVRPAEIRPVRDGAEPGA